MTAGLAGSVPIRSRSLDQLGISYFRFSLTKRVENGLAPILLVKEEQGCEIYYTVQIEPHLRLTATGQIIDPVVRNASTAGYLGCVPRQISDQSQNGKKAKRDSQNRAISQHLIGDPVCAHAGFIVHIDKLVADIELVAELMPKLTSGLTWTSISEAIPKPPTLASTLTLLTLMSSIPPICN